MGVLVGYRFSGRRPPPHHIGPPGGVISLSVLPLEPRSLQNHVINGGGGGYLLLMDWLVSYSVSLGVCLTFICTHVDTTGFPLYVILLRTNEVGNEYICRNVYGSVD
jgi:hypothetical protein